MTFSENHKRRLLASFQNVDEVLSEASARLSAGDAGQLFPKYEPDAAPTQCRTVEDYLARFRHVARQFLDAGAISDARPRIGALWAFRTAINFAQSGLEEITPERLAGYGPVAADDAAEVERTLAELQSILRQLDEYLERGLGGDIAARLARLDQTRDGVGLLHEIERVVATHGLVEFRPTLDWLVERLEHDWLEVAFLGRVSSGKSSLLNALLERSVLPVGVTPVTAVPTRIIPGDAAVTVNFAVGKSVCVGIDRLAEFASEEGNPGNARHVTQIVLQLPSPRLGAGVCFVDTPGLGSLATAGAAQTLAYLPRCDVGVLIVDAVSTLSAEDVAVARRLLEAGAELVPVLGKVDLLAPHDCERLLAYTRRELLVALGTEIEVSSVSAIADGGQQALAWFEARLAPLLRARHALRDSSLRRKIGALRENVVAALRRRIGTTPLDGATDKVVNSATLAEGRRVLIQARERIHELSSGNHRASWTTQMLDLAAEKLAGTWADSALSDDSTAEVLGLALARDADKLGAEFEQTLASSRVALEAAVPLPFRAAGFLPHPTGRPLFDPEPIVGSERFVPGLMRLLGDRGRRAEARRLIDDSIAAPLRNVIADHVDALKRWALNGLADLERGFDAMSASAASAMRTPAEPAAVADLQADLERLNRWNEPKHAENEEGTP